MPQQHPQQGQPSIYFPTMLQQFQRSRPVTLRQEAGPYQRSVTPEHHSSCSGSGEELRHRNHAFATPPRQSFGVRYDNRCRASRKISLEKLKQEAFASDSSKMTISSVTHNIEFMVELHGDETVARTLGHGILSPYRKNDRYEDRDGDHKTQPMAKAYHTSARSSQRQSPQISPDRALSPCRSFAQT